MKLTKPILLFLCLTTISGCNNNEEKNINLLISQNNIVSNINSVTPILVDDKTILFGVYIEKNKINYDYLLSNEPVNTEKWNNDLIKLIPENYCKNNEMKDIREVFTEGVRYNYYIGSELFVSYEVNSSACR
ncbi:hypothetical protein ACS5F0_004067 [Providencia rettgeri]